MACAINGIKPTDFVRMQAKQAAVTDAPEMQSTLLKIASSIFHAAGEGFEGDAAMYDALLNGTSRIRSEFAKKAVLDPILHALYEQSTQEQFEKLAAATGFEKVANITSLFGKAVGFLPDTIQGLAALSILAGGGLGAGWWAMNRDANAASEETAVKEEQAKYYRDLAKRIRRKTGKIKNKALLQKTIENYVAAENPSDETEADVSASETNKENLAEAAADLASSLYA